MISFSCWLYLQVGFLEIILIFLSRYLGNLCTGVEPKMFTFDYSYWSHDGFDVDDEGVSIPSAGSNYASQRMVFNDLGQGVLNNAFEGNYKTKFAV